MEDKTILNATCSICGKKYHRCDSCSQIKSFKPWRSIVDSMDHYRIYLIINDYTNGRIDNLKANDLLSDCDLSELDSFVPEIKDVIKKIQKVEKTTNKIEVASE